MDYIQLKARAKINISLDIAGKFENGYHNLRMIMQTIDLYDTIYIKKTFTGRTVLKCNINRIPTDERNLVYKAIEALRKEYGIRDGIFADLKKNIPTAAGLAGGSSDCAAALIGMRRLFELDMPNEKLYRTALSLGADVPFCLMRGTALAEGKGEILTRLPPFPEAILVLSKPPVGVSTANVFSKVKIDEIKNHPDTEGIIKDIKNCDLQGICRKMYNVLEEITGSDYPVIKEIEESMKENGCMGTLMSGSGPSVFGIFSSRKKARNAYKALKAKGIRETYMTRIFNCTRTSRKPKSLN